MQRVNPLLHNLKYTFSAQKALVIAAVGGVLLTGMMTLAHVSKGWVLDHLVFTLSSNIVLLFAILLFNFSIIKSRLTPGWKYALGIVGSVAVAVLVSALSGWLHILIYDNMRLSDPDSINFTRDIVVALVALLISLLLYNLTRRQQMRLEKEQLLSENLMVRYEALENQLDPHFLFNSLNTLSGLIGTDDERAQQYLQQLASTYRYIIQGKRLVTLEEELNFTHSYCLMMQIRYGDNLHIDNRINSKYLRHSIIPISIQLLIENALKHNVVSDRHPLTIIIESTPNGTIRVSNVMKPKQEEHNGTGLGLANLTKRYQLLCQQEIFITKQDNIFAVEVPLLDPLEAAEIISRIHTRGDSQKEFEPLKA